MNLLRLFGNESGITEFEPGATIFSEGDLGDAMYVVVDGHVALRVDERRFAFLVQQTPFFALHVMRVLAARRREMDRTLS